MPRMWSASRCVKGGDIVYHWGVAVQGKCPFKRPAQMLLGPAAVVSDHDVEGPNIVCVRVRSQAT